MQGSKATITVQETDYDSRLAHPCSCLIVGGCRSGKTVLLMDIFRSINVFIRCPAETKVHFFYGQEQDMYQELKFNKRIICHQNVPSLEELEKLSSRKEPIVFAFDDMMSHLPWETLRDLIVFYRHRNASTLFLCQRLFCSGNDFRTLSYNIENLYFFRNPRNESQYENFCRQMSSSRFRCYTNIFQNVLVEGEPFQCLKVDLNPACPENIRFRSSERLQPVETYLCCQSHNEP